MTLGKKGFQLGNTLGIKGRTPGFKTQVRNWLEENPNRFAEIMDLIELHGKGRRVIECPNCHTEIPDLMSGKLEALTYQADRIKGKPTSKIGLDEDTGKQVALAAYIELCKLQDKQLKEGYNGEEGTVEVTDAEDA